MYKKIITLLFAFAFFPGKIFSQATGEGFLAVSGAVEWQYYEQQNPPNDLFLIPITFSGVSSNYEIVSHLQLIPEVFHLADYYEVDSSRLSSGEVLPFSYANYELQYRVGNWGFISLNLGMKIGHYGYLSDDWTSPSYAIFTAPTATAYISLGKSFMINIPIEVPIGVYLNNIDEYFTAKAGVEIVFDPAGQVDNPVTNNTLFSIGLSYTYLKIVTSDSDEREINYIQPFLKFSFLY